ncbi:serine/threonine protein kinase [Amycolatopsis sp. 195334CR]|nr:serine/threonine protein kinase [Amycolatopsis sp. 195334CR]
MLAELGRGGMGRVLLASGPDGRLVAVKQVLSGIVEDEGFRARFAREVSASRTVSGAYTAAVVDADPHAAVPWLASVFVVGPSLKEALEATGPLPEQAALRLAAGLATALAGIHAAGVVHRDLKPANVLLAEDGPRVVDFGIARAADADGGRGDLTRTGWLVGSPGFASPEQAEGGELGPASDVFSLGIVLAVARSGVSPFAGSSTLQTLNNVVSGEPDLAKVPGRLRPIVAACLAKDPAARPTPARILELVGSLAPSVRPWPEAVHGMITAQRERVTALVSPGAETVVQTTQPQPVAWNAPPGGRPRMAVPQGAGASFPQRPRANAPAAAIAGSLGLATAAMQVWFAIVNIQLGGPPSEWMGLTWTNILGGFAAALCLAATAALIFARMPAGAWTLCGLSALLFVAVFVSPLLRGETFAHQLHFVFSFHKANGTAVGLTVIGCLLTTTTAAVAARLRSPTQSPRGS